MELGHQLMKLIKNRKAVSAVLATILFIIVFVAAIAVVLYIIVRQSQLNTMQTKISEVMNERLREKVNVETLDHHSVLFDGVDDYVEVLDSVTMRNAGNNKETLCFWAKFTNLSSIGNIMMVGRFSTGNAFFMYGYVDYFRLRVDTATNAKDISSGISFASVLNAWHLFTFVYDGTYLYCYLDGVLKNVPATLTGNFANILVTFKIDYIATSFAGIIDEVRIYNRTLSALEIVELYHESYRDNTGLIIYLPLDSNFNDYSGNGNYGTPSGSPTFVSIPEAVFTNIGEHSILIKYIVYVGVNATSTAIPLSPNSSYRVLKEGQTGIITSLGNFFATPS